LPNVGPYIYDVSISGFTRSSIYIYDISSLRVNSCVLPNVSLIMFLPLSVQNESFQYGVPNKNHVPVSVDFSIRPGSLPALLLAVTDGSVNLWA